MKPCNNTSTSLIIAQFSESNKLQPRFKVCISESNKLQPRFKVCISESNKLQPRFKVCNILYLRVLFHSPQLLLTFWFINHNKFKRLESIHVTVIIYFPLPEEKSERQILLISEQYSNKKFIKLFLFQNQIGNV